jgi:RHS repeat-associated protein
MAGISSKAAGKLENKRKFNDGTEFNTDLGLDWYETRFRGYDPQIGRFCQSDPWADVTYENSQYAFANNNPLTFNDPLGLTPGFANDSLGRANDLGNVTVTAKRKVSKDFSPYINFGNGRPGVVASMNDWPLTFNTDRSNDLLDSWAMGLGAENRIYLPYHPMTKRMMNAHRVNKAKAFFYKKYISDYKKGGTLKGASVTGYRGVFGFTELVLAGGDIVEQFVGSFDLDIQMDEKGENVLFIMKNTTSSTSAFYHMANSHDRDPSVQFDARGNLNQVFIWKEPLTKVMVDGLMATFSESGHVVK